MKTSVSCGVSVDGFLARPSGALDFLDAAGSEPHGCDEFIATVDTIVMGRNTFEIVMGWSARFGMVGLLVLGAALYVVKRGLAWAFAYLIVVCHSPRCPAWASVTSFRCCRWCVLSS
jgi:dihydrofolate reductase